MIHFDVDDTLQNKRISGMQKEFISVRPPSVIELDCYNFPKTISSLMELLYKINKYTSTYIISKYALLIPMKMS